MYTNAALFFYHMEKQNRKTENTYDKLLRATKENDRDTVEELIKKGAYTQPTSRDRLRNNDTGPLHFAAANGNLDILNLLLKAKDAEVDVTGDNLCMPLQMAKDPKTIQFLIDKGANVNHQNCHGHTALHTAVANHRVDAAKVLIDNGASPHIKSYPLLVATPLDWAKGIEANGRYKNDEISQYMLSNCKSEIKIGYRN